MEETNIANNQQANEYKIEPSNDTSKKLNAKDWPLLLKDFDKMNVLTNSFHQGTHGCTPLRGG